MKNERTGTKPAQVAGKILAHLKEFNIVSDWVMVATDISPKIILCTLGELKTLCASALTQAPDKPKRKKV